MNRFSQLKMFQDIHKGRLWNLKTLEGSGTEGAYVPWGLAVRNTLIFPTTTTGNDLTPLAWAPYPFWWQGGKGKRNEKVTARQAKKPAKKKKVRNKAIKLERNQERNNTSKKAIKQERKSKKKKAKKKKERKKASIKGSFNWFHFRVINFELINVSGTAS